MTRLSNAQFKSAMRKVLAEAASVISQIKSARGIFGFYKVAPTVIRAVEDIAAEIKIASEDKKALAVQAILILVPDRWIPDAVIEPIVGFVVELVLSRLKKKGEI